MTELRNRRTGFAAPYAWRHGCWARTPCGLTTCSPTSRSTEETPQTTTAIDKPTPADLGVKLGGSARKGHTIALEREDALSEIFGTADAKQASAFLSHCLKVLKPDKAGDVGEMNDERHFLLSIVRDLAPRDAVERMLVVQMAATHVAVIRAGRWMATSEPPPA